MDLFVILVYEKEKKLNKLLVSFLIMVNIAFSQYASEKEDMNPTSASYGNMVWQPTYDGYITIHYFTTQGWAGWTSIFGQLSDFQEELHMEGYDKVVIIGIGHSAQQNFNSNFCANSNLPLVVDVYPDYEIRDAFNGSHKWIVILDVDQNEIGRRSLNSGLNASSENYIRDIIIDNYPEEEEEPVLGDINVDEIVNIQDIILLINMILNQESEEVADINFDGNVDILDVVLLVNMILHP